MNTHVRTITITDGKNASNTFRVVTIGWIVCTTDQKDIYTYHE